MKATMGMTVMVAATLLAVGLAGGQEQRAARRQPEVTARPAPAPEMEKLAHLVGVWDVAATYEPSGDSRGGEGRGREVIRRGPGGYSLISDFRVAGPMGRFEGHGILLWDPAEGVYKAFWIDSLMPGVLVTSRGHWEGNDLVFESDAYAAMGHQLKARQVMTDIAPTSGTSRFYISMDGAPMKLAETLKYTKVERPAPKRP